jgi:hypothetical protein
VILAGGLILAALIVFACCGTTTFFGSDANLARWTFVRAALLLRRTALLISANNVVATFL